MSHSTIRVRQLRRRTICFRCWTSRRRDARLDMRDSSTMVGFRKRSTITTTSDSTQHVTQLLRCKICLKTNGFSTFSKKNQLFKKWLSAQNSGYRIFPDLSLAGSQTTCIHVAGNQFSSKSLRWIESYDHFCTIAIPKMRLASAAQLTPTARVVLLSENDSRLY